MLTPDTLNLTRVLDAQKLEAAKTAKCLGCHRPIVPNKTGRCTDCYVFDVL